VKIKKKVIEIANIIKTITEDTADKIPNNNLINLIL